MTSPRRPSPGPTGDEPRATVQGAVIIAVAVLIGLVLLAKGFDQEGGVVQAGNGPTTTTTTTVAGGPGQTTTTTVAARPPAQVSVVVANGTGQSGVAGTNADKLEAAGYTKVETANAPTTATSAVWFTAGYQPEATAVAQALGIPATAVQALPATPPFPVGTANVAVVIGADKA